MNINATLIGELIAFLVFVLFCMKYVWPPIIGAIEARQQKKSQMVWPRVIAPNKTCGWRKRKQNNS